MAQAFTVCVQAREGSFERAQDFEPQLHLLCASEPQVRSWFGFAKGFPTVGQLTKF